MKNFKKQFGGKVTNELLAQYGQSVNWKDGKFQNLEETGMSISFWDIPKLLYKQFIEKEKREPQHALPVIPLDKALFLSNDVTPKFAWYGHSAILMRLNARTILIDPMLGGDASPIAPMKTKRFSKNTLDLIDGFPEIDLMLISHDHYDHLDYDSIVKLKPKTKQYFVALGVKRHLVAWGIDPSLITEFDWWQDTRFSDIKITFTPTRHFSGRGISDRAKSLWGGWVIQSTENKIWFSGDSGYGEHFKEIGKRLGPFDFAFMECGQYNEKWSQIHMFPQESVQAALDAHAKKVMPVHWSGFALAQHSWTESVEQFYEAAELKKIDAIYPKLGQLVQLHKDFEPHKWWE